MAEKISKRKAKAHKAGDSKARAALPQRVSEGEQGVPPAGRAPVFSALGKPDLPERPWWKRLGDVLQPRRDEGMREHMAAVKAGVIHELENLSAEKGVALSGQPFRTVVLPQVRRRRRWGWPLGIGAAMAAVLLGLLLFSGRGHVAPDQVIRGAVSAMHKGDVEAFERYVDTASVASSLVSQVFGGAPQEGVNSRMTAFIKPELAESLRADILFAVRNKGDVGASEKSLLVKMWQDMGEGNLAFGPQSVVIQDEAIAVVEIPLERTDLGLMLPLQVVMSRASAKDAWRVVDIPNFSAVLESLDAAGKAARKNEEGGMERTRVADLVHVSDIRKGKAGPASLLVEMKVANRGGFALSGLHLQIEIGDAAGHPMKSIEVPLEGILEPGESREQTWTVPVDMTKAAERYVMDLPLSALSVKVVPVSGAAKDRVSVAVEGVEAV